MGAATGIGKQEEKAAVGQKPAADQGRAWKVAAYASAWGELRDGSFAHMYETGGMRRTHLRFHDNIIKLPADSPRARSISA